MENKNKILLFNPRSALKNHRMPNSILQIGASIYGKLDFVFVDGNLEQDPLSKIMGYFQTGQFRYFACTVMPGPQLKQAIPFTRSIKERYPGIITIWGGYFASNHYTSAMRSGFIDFLIRGCGDIAFPRLLETLEAGDQERLAGIRNLVFLDPQKKIVKNLQDPLPDMDSLPALPYGHLEKFYDLERYIVKTFIGQRTLTYHSSMGCPHNCSFCGVATVHNGNWKAKSAEKMVDDIITFKNIYQVDAIEFVDSNFFSSHARTISFCRSMKGQNINWWAEGRIDTLNRFTDEELVLLKESGCCLVLMGAETGDEELLQKVNKGGNYNPADTKKLVARFKKAGIIPELSLVLGFPAENESQVWKSIRKEITFIRELKKINPHTEIIIYIYSPVPAAGTLLDEAVQRTGFAFPEMLEDWLKPEWEDLDLRRNPGTPWLKPFMIRRIRNFETVMNAAFPGKSNFRIKGFRKILLSVPGKFRYYLRWYRYPYFLKLLLKLAKYQRPEKEGFYSE
jgi:anaerobic magnesium-protoporphyrin IX monomethyl ester cyclase